LQFARLKCTRDRGKETFEISRRLLKFNGQGHIDKGHALTYEAIESNSFTAVPSARSTVRKSIFPSSTGKFSRFKQLESVARDFSLQIVSRSFFKF